MKTILTLFTTILLASCIRKEFYTVCPVDVPKAWKRPPQGSLTYRKTKHGLYGCLNGECNMFLYDYQIILDNMAKCEFARQSLVDLFEAVNDPKLRDAAGQPIITEPQPPAPTNEFFKPVDPEVLKTLPTVPR